MRAMICCISLSDSLLGRFHEIGALVKIADPESTTGFDHYYFAR